MTKTGDRGATRIDTSVRVLSTSRRKPAYPRQVLAGSEKMRCLTFADDAYSRWPRAIVDRPVSLYAR